jgi:hypothetical protein
MGKKYDENKKYKKEWQGEENKTKLPGDAASLHCHEGKGPRKPLGKNLVQ